MQVPEFEKTMLNIAWDNYEVEIKSRRDLDTKATLLVSTVGLLIALSIRFASFEQVKSLILVYFFILGILSIMGAAVFGICSLGIRRYKIPDTWKIIKELKDKNVIEQIRGIVVTLSETQQDFIRINNKKAQYLKIGYIILLIGFVFLILSNLGMFIF